MQTNDVRIAAAGTVAWTIALVVLLLVGLPSEERWWLWVCVTGIGIGLFAMWYIPRLQAGRARAEAARAQRRAERRAVSPPEGSTAEGSTAAEPTADPPAERERVD